MLLWSETLLMEAKSAILLFQLFTSESVTTGNGSEEYLDFEMAELKDGLLKYLK